MFDAGTKKAWEDIRYSFVVALLDSEIKERFGESLNEVIKIIDRRIEEASEEIKKSK